MKAVDLFCGVGGMSLGFKRAGVNVIAAFDSDWRHVETYKKNSPSTNVVMTDVSLLNSKKLKEHIEDFKDIDIIFGGPPLV